MSKNFKLYLLVWFALLYYSNPCFAQTPSVVWQRIFGDKAQAEFGYASVKLGPNLYVHGGINEVPLTTTSNAFLLFTNANGDSLYSRKVQKLENGRITGLVANDDGSFIACGRYIDTLGTWSLFLVKFNQLGGIVWQRDFPGAYGNSQKVIRLPDGYLIITSNKVRIIKTDLSGNQQWIKVYGQDSGGENLSPLPDGSFLATGWATKGGSPSASTFHKLNYWFLKLRPNGDTIFTKVLGNPGNMEVGYAAASTADGGVVVAGAYVANVSQTKRQGQVLKLDSLLRLQWEMKVMPNGGRYDNGCEFWTIQPTISGDYVVAGQNIRNTYNESYIARIAPPSTVAGNASINWSQFFNGGYFRDMLFENDGSAVVGGTGGITSAKIFAVKISNLGQPYRPNYCTSPPQAQVNVLVRLDSVIFTNANNSASGLRYGVVSKWEFIFGDGSKYVAYKATDVKRVAHKYLQPQPALYGTPVKLVVTNNLFCTDTLTLYPFGGQPTGISEATAQQVEVKLYPNPMQEQTTLELKNYPRPEKLQLEVTDLLGRKVPVLQKQIQPGKWHLEKGSVSQGLYIYRVYSPAKTVAQGKLVVH